jgi:PAS domain-containing protein
VTQVRTRALRLKLEQSHAGGVREVLDESLELSSAILQELAGAHLHIQQLAKERQRALEHWDYLFDHMLSACLLTDVHGTILNANRAAALLLNLSAKSLRDRLLLHFVQERDACQEILATMRIDGTPIHTELTVRPRERACFRARLSLLPQAPGDLTTWLWFMTADPGERAARGAEPPASSDN